MFRSLVVTILSVLWAVVLVLVGGRFFALIADANRDSELIRKLYDWSEFWVEPFFTMFDFQNEAVDGGGTFEPASLLGFAVYFLVGLLVMAIVSGAMFTRFRHA